MGVRFDGLLGRLRIKDVAAAVGATWGSITGTLTDQTDLKNALDGKTATNHDHVGGDGAQIDHAGLSNLTTGDPHTQYLKETDFDDIQRFGFLNQTETTIGFDDSTYVFTLTDAGSGWSYWRSGVKYTITGNKTVKIADPPVNYTLYFIYIDATDGTLSASTSAWTLNDTKVPVATIYWNSTATPKYVLAEERHTCLIDRRMHRYEHTTEGTKLVSGATISDYTVAPVSPADDDNTFALSQTVIADEDIFLTLDALADGNGTDNNYYVVSRTTDGYVWTASPVPFLYTTDGYIQWNSTAMTEGGNGNFYNYFVGACNIAGDMRFFLLPGRAEHATAAAAYGESISSFDLSGFINAESVFLYQITFGASASYTTKGKCRISRVARVTANAITTTVSALTDHNTLAGLQGGTTGEYYHLTSAELTKLTGIAEGAEVNVNADWSASSGDAQILNKPTLGDSAAKNVGTETGTVAAGDHTHAQLHDAVTITGNGIGLSGQQLSLSIGTGATQVAAGDHAHTGTYEPANANIQSHISNTSNPHSVTAAQVGAHAIASSTLTDSDTLTATHTVVLCNKATAMTVTLPAAASHTGRIYHIKNINVGIVTIDGNASELIEGQTTVRLEHKYDSMTIACDGTSWYIIGGKWSSVSMF